jgi:SprT-like protein
MDDEQLQQWVEKVSLRDFNRPFLHRATFNHRLRTTGGRYFMRSHNIDISWSQYEAFGVEEIEKIIKHELCHYHLHLQRKGYKHQDADFRRLLAEVGGSLHCQAIARKPKVQPFRYKLECVSCGMSYMRKRRMDPGKYACGKCRGKLRLLELAPAGKAMSGEKK